jgi:hypothetical protein
LSLACLLLAAQLAAVPAGAAASSPGDRFRGALQGKIVQSGLSGFEPDFDPIDRVIIAATLHDPRSAPAALPDSKLILSTYLENFQPDTTPVLPDLLHPNQTANGLGGFMTGKAALVNAAGRVSYRGGLLAEVFLDNSVHLVVDLQRVNAPASAPTLRIQGVFTLSKDLSVHGLLQSTRALSRPELALLRVPHGPAPSWQTVVKSMVVHPPKMMGTAGNGSQGTPAQQAVPQPTASPLVRIAIAVALCILGLAALGGAVWWRRSAKKAQPPVVP